jgi:hypothetical protein
VSLVMHWCRKVCGVTCMITPEDADVPQVSRQWGGIISATSGLAAV